MIGTEIRSLISEGLGDDSHLFSNMITLQPSELSVNSRNILQLLGGFDCWFYH